MTKTVNVAMVGCGGMASYYLSVYRDLEWVKVTKCIDINSTVAEAAAKLVSAPIVTSQFEVALDDDVDAVIINTPNHLHRQQAIAVIEAGKHVLLQKPVAANLQDAQAIADVAARSQRTVGLYMSYFDQPLIHDLRDFIAGGFLGHVVHLYARLMHKGGMIASAQALNGNRTWRTSLAETGGGCFIQLAVHYLHIFKWLTGAEIQQVKAFTTNRHSPQVEGEDLACAVIQLSSGALATIDTAWCTNGEQLAIHGTLGRIEYRNNRWLYVASSKGEFTGRVLRYSGGLESGFDGVHGIEQSLEIKPPAYGDVSNPFNQHRMFLEAVRDGKPAFCTIASGVSDLRCVYAVYESAGIEQPVSLETS
jgi:UDP-N-acetyl-2-amino-2-deoxyglucuronate dehydrogenase